MLKPFRFGEGGARKGAGEIEIVDDLDYFLKGVVRIINNNVQSFLVDVTSWDYFLPKNNNAQTRSCQMGEANACDMLSAAGDSQFNANIKRGKASLPPLPTFSAPSPSLFRIRT